LKKVLVKKSNNQVLVKKAVRAVYPVSGGGPVMMLGGGGGGGGPRGKTLRERAGGFLGGVVGVAGALTGNHRSIGGLTNAMVSGGATGSQLGSALGRKFVGRRGQELANLKEAEKRENARLAAEHKLEFGASGFRDKSIADQRRAYLRGVAVRQAEDKQRQSEADAASTAYARTFGSERGEEDRVDAETMRNLRERFGGMSPFEASQRVNAMNEAFDSRPTPEPADFEPTDGSYPVAVVDPMANSPIAQGAPPLPPANNEGSALDAINNVEQAGEKMMAETGMDHDGELTDNEKALQRTLEQNQQQPNEEEEQQRPLFSQVRVQPPGQRSLFDKPE